MTNDSPASAPVAPRQPEVNQRWTHKQFGGEFVVQDVSAGRVKIQSNRPGTMFQMMFTEQLWEHYLPLD